MEKRFDSMVFPGGKSKAFTLSYDDGVVQDRRLADILRSRGIKCTFNISAGLLGHQDFGGFPGMPELDLSKLATEELHSVYNGHEIAGHSLYHSDLSSVGTPRAMYEIIEDKRRLESFTKIPLKMFAYPFGASTMDTRRILQLAGYRGARTINSSHNFYIPQDFLNWHPTCHHNDPDLMNLAQQFLDLFPYQPALFYVWGHAYEFDSQNNWYIIENLADFMFKHNQKIWFATNGEIIDYVTAYRQLEYSADGSFIRNPSSIDITIRTTMSATQTIPAGQCVFIEPTPL